MDFKFETFIDDYGVYFNLFELRYSDDYSEYGHTDRLKVFTTAEARSKYAVEYLETIRLSEIQYEKWNTKLDEITSKVYEILGVEFEQLIKNESMCNTADEMIESLISELPQEFLDARINGQHRSNVVLHENNLKVYV